MKRINISRRNFNAVISSMAVLLVGIMSLWFPTAVLNIPLPKDAFTSALLTAIWQTVAVVIFPYYWAVKRLDMSMADLGVSKANLGKSIFLGCALYFIALVVFIHCSTNNIMMNHVITTMPTVDAYLFMSTMALVAAGTDFTTRGYILLVLTKYSNVYFAVFVQNLVWFVGHISEINFLANCIGFFNSILLTLVLGIIGDVIVLKLRNVIGLAIAHILLNVILTIFMRNFS